VLSRWWFVPCYHDDDLYRRAARAFPRTAYSRPGQTFTSGAADRPESNGGERKKRLRTHDRWDLTRGSAAPFTGDGMLVAVRWGWMAGGAVDGRALLSPPPPGRFRPYALSASWCSVCDFGFSSTDNRTEDICSRDISLRFNCNHCLILTQRHTPREIPIAHNLT